MYRTLFTLALAAATGLLPGLALADRDDDDHRDGRDRPSIQLGPRPFFLVNDMTDSPLKQQLLTCTNRESFKRTQFSIGHRGAALQFPEHTQQSSNAMSRSRRTRRWSAATPRTTCIPPPTSWPLRWHISASNPSFRRPSTRMARA
jgi:hypothetical protein